MNSAERLAMWQEHINHALMVYFENDVCKRARCESCGLDLPPEGVAFNRVNDEPA